MSCSSTMGPAIAVFIPKSTTRLGFSELKAITNNGLVPNDHINICTLWSDLFITIKIYDHFVTKMLTVIKRSRTYVYNIQILMVPSCALVFIYVNSDK